MTTKARLLELIDQRCLMANRNVILSAGDTSLFYFDCKRATLHGESLHLIANAFLDELAKLPVWPDAIGGLTIGADFIVAAVVQLAHQRGAMINGSIVRKQPKLHGTQSRIEHDLPPGTRMVVVDDVVTTGSSIMQAIEQFKAADYDVIGVVALIDREEGGMDGLAAHYPVRSIFRKRDFARIA